MGAIFETGMFEIDSLMTIMPLSDVQAVVGSGVSGIEVRLKDVYQANAVRGASSGSSAPRIWAGPGSR